MRIKILSAVCCLCAYLRMFDFFFTIKGNRHASMLIHGMIYLEGQVNCKRITEYWKKDIKHQRLVEFLNHGKFDLRGLNSARTNHLLNLALKHKKNQQDILGDYLLFSIDPSNFKKYKNRKTQGVHYTGDSNGRYKAHSFVMSSFVYGQSCIPFKKTLYWGKKGVPKGRQISKSQIYLKLARKSEKVACSKKRISVFDGEGCRKNVLPYFHKSPDWSGFVTKFPRTRNIVIGEKTIHIRKYLSELKLKDFIEIEIGGKTVHYLSFKATVPSLDFLEEESNFVVILDKPGNLEQKNMRVLITDVAELTSEQILLIYLRRWKQETYHQILKDRLGVRSYKHRKLKAVIRLLELGDLAYSFLEYRRLKEAVWNDSISEVRNELIWKFERKVSAQLGLILPKPFKKAA